MFQRPPNSAIGNFFQPQPSPQIVPTKLDVLYGRGSKINQHPGNILFRKIVEHNKLLYRTCKKHEKTAVAQAIVEALESRSPPIRFLEIGNYTMRKSQQIWVLVPKERAIRKTIQALRERARDKDKCKKSQGKGESNSEEDITISSDFDSTTDNSTFDTTSRSSSETKSSSVSESKHIIKEEEIVDEGETVKNADSSKGIMGQNEKGKKSNGTLTVGASLRESNESRTCNPNTVESSESNEVEALMRNLLQGSDICEWNLEKEDATAKKLMKQSLSSMHHSSDVTLKDHTIEEKAWAIQQHKRQSSDDGSVLDLSSVDTPVSNLQLTASFDFKEADWMRECDFEE